MKITLIYSGGISEPVTSAIPIPGKPALLIGGRKSFLCVADLHIGYEIELRESGFNIPDQTDIILKSLTEIERGDHLIILGDLKHSIPAARVGESLRVSRLLKELDERFSEITLVVGNHDGSIERSIPESVRLIGAEGFRISSIGLAHGHSWPSEEVMQAPILLWGHLHPAVRMRDRLGAALTIKCWLRGSVHRAASGARYRKVGCRESIVMPSFNHMMVGTPVNERKERRLSPLTRSGFINLNEQHGYTLDGVDLGEISKISKKQPR